MLKDNNNVLISGGKVKFYLNGKYVGFAITDKNGMASFKLTAKALKAAKAGKRNLVIKYTDSNGITASETVKITIKKEKTKIVAKNKSFKKSLKVKKFAITLKNSKGKAVKKLTVALKVNGKTYKAKTNSKGKAVFKIKNLKNKGKFTATLKCKGNKYYKASSKKVRLTVKK